MSYPFHIEPFRPVRGLTNPHLQTAAAQLWRPENGIVFRRERLFTPDDDFIDVDFADVDGVPWHLLGDDAPVGLVLHGLEGSARRGYSHELYKQLAWRGIRPVGMNYRSCSGEMNWQRRVYHAGATDDVNLVVDWLRQRYPDVPLGIVGISLGGGMLLKYLGEPAANASGKVAAAVAISNAFDMMTSSDVLANGLGRFYTQHFVKKIMEKLEAKSALYGDSLDLDAVRSARSFRELDDALTAPLNGFRDAADYYEQCSAGQFLPTVSCPTLLIRALDDPFFGPDIPYNVIAANPNLHTGFTTHGGHVGFVERRQRRVAFWSERQAARFLSWQLIERPIGQHRYRDVSL